MTTLALVNISKHYGHVRAVDDISLRIDQGELVALLGPSGCGKTTLLRMIAGFVQATSGQVLLGEQDVTTMQPHKRNTGMVFQGYALFPHMTVHENVAFGLEMRKVAADEIANRVEDALTLVHMTHYAGRYPRELSGGQQQRVAVARALVIRPDVFLLDEPLSSLDAKLRQSVGQEIRALQQRLGLTTVFVTHDQNEALMLADRLVVMNQGQVVQSGNSRELYDKPRSRFVASFLGSTNLLEGRRTGDHELTTRSGTRLRGSEVAKNVDSGGEYLMCVRPENIIVGDAAEGLPNSFRGRIESATYLGSTTEFTILLEAGDEIVAQVQNGAGKGPSPGKGEAVTVGWLPEAGLLLADA